MDGCDLNREGLSSPRLATAGSGSGGGGSPESSPERDLANGNGRGLDKSDELDPGSRAMASGWVTVEQKALAASNGGRASVLRGEVVPVGDIDKDEDYKHQGDYMKL